MEPQKKNIRLLSIEELKNLFVDLGEAKYRHKQIYEWLWKKGAGSFDDMTNIDKELRNKLAEDFFIPKLKIKVKQKSIDGTIKVGFLTFDNYAIEGVIIPSDNRMTVCISSQIGCSLSCKFCATGLLDRKRNLSFDEIYDQVFLLNEIVLKDTEKKISNVVYMGMGEPLLNYKNVLRSIDMLTSNDGLALSPKRITVSTAGISKQIWQLGEDKVKFNLALSLHAVNDVKRNQIMTINEKNNIASLEKSLNHFYAQTKNDITLEYVLLKNVNDDLKDAEELHKFYKRIPTHLINIIEYNKVPNINFQKADENKLNTFTEYLSSKRVNVRVRRSRGQDIDAACGQLANRH